MSNNNEVGLLLRVDTDATESLKTMAALRSEIVNTKQQQKELDRATAEGAAEYERLGIQIKQGTKTLREYEKEVTNAIVQEKSQSGSIKSLRAELSSAKAAYTALSKAERDGAKGTELLTKTANLNSTLKELESAYGDNQRKVGEYENAGRSLRGEIRALTEGLANMKLEGREGDETYQNMIARLAELKDAMADVSVQSNQMASDTSSFDTAAQGVRSVSAAYGAFTIASSLLGSENEELDGTMKKLFLAAGALQALTTLQTLAQKQSNIYRAAANILQKIGIRQTTAETLATSANVTAITAEAAAENASTAAKVKGVIVTKAVTAAQWLWNAAVSANPLIALVVVAAAAIAGIVAFTGWLGKESAATKESSREQERLNTSLKEGAELRDSIDRKGTAALNERLIAGRRELQQLKERGASESSILQETAKIDREATDIKLKNSRARREQALYELEVADRTLAAQEKERRTVSLSASAYEELTERIEETIKTRNGLSDSILSDTNTILNLTQDNIEREYTLQKQLKDTASAASDAAKARVDAAISVYEKELDGRRGFSEAMLRAESAYQSDEFATRQGYAIRSFELGQQADRAKLDNLRKHNRVTESEYTRSLGILDARAQEFANNQAVAISKHFDTERKAILGLLSKTVDEEVAAIENKYADALNRLSVIKPPTMLQGEDADVYANRLADYEAFAFEQAATAIRIEEEKAKELEKVRESHLAKQIKDIEDSAKKAYSSDLEQHQNNERKKLDATEAMLIGQVAAKRAAGLETYNEDAQLEQLALQRIALNLNRDLILAGDNAKKKHALKAKALSDELVLHTDNADKIVAINKQMAELEAELWDGRISAYTEWSSKISEILNSVTSLTSSSLDKQLQSVKETYDSESAALADKYALGVLTEAQYNRDVLKLEQQREKEEAKIARQKAIRERAGKVFSVATDTAVGVMKSVAASPLTGGLPWSAIVAATGALNLAAILSEPLPKAARGGLIKGAPHSAGGAIIEAEGGEAIMTKGAVSLFGPVLSALNELGGGAPFAGALSDGGYMLRSNSPQRPLSAQDIADAVGRVNIYTTVEDINRGQEQYTKIQARGTVFDN